MLTNGRIQLAFALVVLVLLASGGGAAVRLLYPMAAMAVGWRLLTTSSGDYIGFVIWLWVLSPLVRRVADLQAGPQDPSFVLLTPYLVSAAGAAQTAVRAIVAPHLYRPERAAGQTMFLLAAAGAGSGTFVGFAARTPDAAIETLNWLVPLAFGCYVASCTRELPAIERTVSVTFERAAFVIGVYGVYQFFRLPDWDANWMLLSGMRSIGSAEAFAVRVFSTMHSPGVLGYFLLVPLVFWITKPRLARLVPLCLASAVLLLSQVRTAWLGFAVAAILAVVSLRLATGARVVLLTVFGAICITPFLQVPEVSERVSARLETVRDLPSYDQSAVSRLEGHRRVFEFATDHPLGVGIGASPPQIQDVVGMRDGVVVAALVQFGLIGTALYAIALLLLASRLWTYYRTSRARPEALALACAGLGLLSTVLLGIPTAGPAGGVLWLIGGLAAAAGARQPVTATRRPVAATRPPITAAAT